MKLKYKIEDIICIDETSIKSLQNEIIVIVIKIQSQEVFKNILVYLLFWLMVL